MLNICPPRGERGSVKGWEQSRFPTWICAAVVAPPPRRRPTSGQCRSSQPLLQSTLFLHASYTVVLASALLRLVRERGRRTANFSERSGTEARGGREFSFLSPPQFFSLMGGESQAAAQWEYPRCLLHGWISLLSLFLQMK